MMAKLFQCFPFLSDEEEKLPKQSCKNKKKTGAIFSAGI